MGITVKLVYKDQYRDQQNVTLIHRWSLHAGSIAWNVYTWGPVQCGLYKQMQMVLIYRWSLDQVDCISIAKKLRQIIAEKNCYRAVHLDFI